MAKIKVFGIQDLDFTTKDNKHISGLKFHCSYPSESVHCRGEMYDKLFVSMDDKRFPDAKAIQPGDVLDVSYNRYGGVNSWQISK